MSCHPALVSVCARMWIFNDIEIYTLFAKDTYMQLVVYYLFPQCVYIYSNPQKNSKVRHLEIVKEKNSKLASWKLCSSFCWGLLYIKIPLDPINVPLKCHRITLN